MSDAADREQQEERSAADAPAAGAPASCTHDPDMEMSAGRRRWFRRVALGVGIFGAGVFVGLSAAPEAPLELQARGILLERELQQARAENLELQRKLHAESAEPSSVDGALKDDDRRRHELYGKLHTHELRRVGAQAAAELMQWFVKRWNELLDHPRPDDRVTRRAEALGLLVGGMAQNLAPEHYVPWQAELFLNEEWLGELHFDMDGDGLPAPRAAVNPKDSFTNVSVCQIAMAINQSVTDALVLVTPDMRCDRPDARMSIFLQGRTFDDALSELVKALRAEGFRVLERHETRARVRDGHRVSDQVRLILLGNKP